MHPLSISEFSKVDQLNGLGVSQEHTITGTVRTDAER